MKYTSKKQVIKAAQEMGSKATTFEGAAKYILSNTGSVLQPFRFNGWKRDAEAADKYKKEKRKNRICLKYAGMLRLPGYLTEEDKQIINNHPASVEYRKLLSLPDFVRAFYISHIVDIPRLNGFVRKCRKAKGRFINIPAIARHAFETCDFGRTRRNHIGENRIYPGIRTTSYERGRNPWGGKWTHNDYYADYTLIAPDTTKNIYSLYYVDSNGKEHKVLKKEMTQRKLSSNKLALTAMISPANFSQALNQKLPMFPAWRQRLAAALDMSEEALFPEYHKEKGD